MITNVGAVNRLNASRLVTKTQFDSERKVLKKIEDVDKNVPNTSGLVS